MRLLYFINKGHQRLSELQRKTPAASRRVLEMQLKKLEQHKLVTKKIFEKMPPKAEYSLSDFGKSLLPIINELGLWADKNQDQLREVILKGLEANQ